ncbi:MAG: hypothetical protein DDT26_00274 [Dehalococcoidia bacterium]|nr:hypothetical protein [Chloroflexota bacterium]
MSSNDFIRRGIALVRNGYRVIPIGSSGKRPGIDDWQKTRATERDVKRWGENGFAAANIGVLTENTPAVDIDIYDAEIADEMEAWVVENIANACNAPRRVGRAPKRLLLFRTDEPFRKQQAEYADKTGKKHKVEVLGAGQQFVAYGTHPDTKRAFDWTTFDQPLDTFVEALPVLTVDDGRAIVAAFERIARRHGWVRVSGSAQSAVVDRGTSKDDGGALLSYKAPLKASVQDIRDALEYVSPDDGYDKWCEIGMALHHQFNGSDEGLELWAAWSQASAQYDRDEIENKWPSFSETPDGRLPVTAATLFKHANDAKSLQQEEQFDRVLNVIRTETDAARLFKDVAKEVASCVSTDLQFEIAVKKLQEQAKNLTGVSPRLEVVRKALKNAAARKSEVAHPVPDWCDGWVYIENGDRFFNVENKQELTERGFNAKFDRFCITDENRALGVSLPEAPASKRALNVYNMPTVYSTVYLPGFPRIVEILGRTRANTYDETSVPESRAAETPDEFEAIRTVERHFETTFSDSGERTLVKDFLAYNIQFPSEKIAWGLLIVGAEGAGKTWFLKFMQMMLGPQNVAPLAASALQDGVFNPWAEGTKMRFIEEIRMHGHNRFEVIEKLKEPVGNDDIEIRRMSRDRYVIPNVTNYALLSNYWDALPIKKTNRRYLVVGTRLQSDDDVIEFNRRHPDYFKKLFDATFEHAAVLRGWMMSYMISPLFEPKKPAPETPSRRKMADLADMSDENDGLADLLEESSNRAISNEVLLVEALKAEADRAGLMLPSAKALQTMLNRIGFVSLGRLPVGLDGAKCRVLTRTPLRFPGDEAAVREAVTRYLQTGELGVPDGGFASGGNGDDDAL